VFDIVFLYFFSNIISLDHKRICSSTLAIKFTYITFYLVSINKITRIVFEMLTLQTQAGKYLSIIVTLNNLYVTYIYLRSPTKSRFEMCRVVSFLVIALVLSMAVVMALGYPCVPDNSDLDNKDNGNCYLKTSAKNNYFKHRLNIV